MQSTETVTKPSKQRRMLHQAADHVRHKFFAAHLSPELRASHLLKTFQVRSGDTVRIMRGDHKGFEGKVNRIDKRKFRIYVEGLTREKVDGTTIFLPIHSSKVMITNLNLDDKWRKKILERKKLWQVKPKETGRKPKEEEKPKLEHPAEIIEAELPTAKEKVAEERGTEEKPAPEKALAKKEPVRKKTTRAKRKKPKKATIHETRAESKEKGKEKKPRTEKKKPKRKTAKKTEGEE